MQARTVRGRHERGTPVGLRQSVWPALVLMCGAWLGVMPAAAQTRGPQSVAPVAEGLIEAVVNISTSQAIKGPQGLPLPSVPKGSPYHEYFDEFFDNRNGRSGSDRMVSSLGSGFIIDGKEGIIVTNNHVIDGAEEIQINLHDGSKLKAELLGKDTKTDIALLKVTPKTPLKAVKFGSSAAIRVGDWVMAIGNPFGLGGSVTAGDHLGQGAQHQFRAVRRLPADRRLDQQGQLGRSAVQYGRRGRRREHGDHLAHRRLDRHRLCGAGRHGRPCRAAVAPVS